MADGIHGIGYGNTSGIGGSYVPQRKGNDVDAQNAQDQTAYNANQEHKDINPDEVMKFMANNNFFMPVNVETKPASEVGGVDAGAEERIAGYMERFEEIFSIIEQEFGTERAPLVMDYVMDSLMGMA